MNHLNSVLLEGEVSEILKSEKREGEKSLFPFKINTRSMKKAESGEAKEIVSSYEISTGGRLAEVCREHLSIGRGVRIVGKLAVKTDGKAVYIQAEHVEFKPERKEILEEEGEKSCLTQEI